MSILPILRWPDPRLSKVCAPVAGDVRVLAKDMLETMYAAPGRGLAAPQVGVMLRLFVMDVTWKEGAPDPQVLINPEVIDSAKAQVEGEEGCLSLPGIAARVLRPEAVTMAWYDPDAVRHRAHLTGFAARCAQHELDHLDGIVTLDHVDAATRAQLEADYAR